MLEYLKYCNGCKQSLCPHFGYEYSQGSNGLGLLSIKNILFFNRLLSSIGPNLIPFACTEDEDLFYFIDKKTKCIYGAYQTITDPGKPTKAYEDLHDFLLHKFENPESC